MAIFVLDAAALLNAGFSFDSQKRYACTGLVFDEWKSYSQKLLAENAFQNGLLSVIDPCPLSLQRAQALAQKTGTQGLSAADESIVALAIELKERKQRPLVLTDDFSLQNLLKHAKVRFEGVAQGRIKKAKTFPQSPKTG